MEENDMIQMALDAGFLHAKVMDQSDLMFDAELRRYCEANTCGNFGANYACPPDCGTPGEMEAKTRKYKKALVLQTIQQVDSVMDEAQIKEVRRAHNLISLSLTDQFRKAGIHGLPVMAGPCSLCAVCARKQEEPCHFPERVASCLSAYCIDAYRMAQECEMDYWCGEDKVAFFSIYLFDEAED
ncbi:DUF2284 domain-containing protein [Cuneatibacter sp. NSJ-177]|uniref:DUF2284 domain-containing protein n=1 Tax=Cuneatibacter sp. NSJ-177 TaxID=2931401 RepID=UPI001FD44765|nr:DUF2284 domain-containing protein [Cuneatibacter sp. NSJ-177]MCJ7837239.1 DUF2284 domain-containing protein [Cuneatibacter sp. NSJ-177]